MKNTIKVLGIIALTAIIGFSMTACPEEQTSEHVHQWGEWTQTTAPTCTEAGVETRTCALDAAHTETRAGAAALGHDWEWVETPATYTAAGVETKTCKHDPSHTDGTRPGAPQLIYTAAGITGLGTWLTDKPANTAATAFIIKLDNVDDITNLKTTLNGAEDKYVYLDLSGSTITSIPDNAFNTGAPNYSGCATLVGITLPDSVTSIGSVAFAFCTSLASVTIPNSVTSIGDGAFAGTSLASVTIPDSVTSIGDNTFQNCTSLTSVTIPNSVTSIEQWAFSGCTSLASVTIPNSVTSIGSSTFLNCSSLTSITIPNSVTSIGNGAFQNCPSLASVTIGSGVTSIGNRAFDNRCTSLTSVTFQGTIASSGFHNTAFSGLGDLRAKFYATNTTNGTPGTYTTTAPVSSSSVWTKQN